MWSKHLFQNVLKYWWVAYNTQYNVNPNSVVIIMYYLGNDDHNKITTVQMQLSFIEIC